MKLAALALVASVALVAAPLAAAKGYQGPVQLCGADRCVPVGTSSMLRRIELTSRSAAAPTVAPPLAPYVMLRAADPNAAVIAYVVEGTNTAGWIFDLQRRWIAVDRVLLNRLRFAPVRRFTAPRPWRVLVDGRPVAHPERFSVLLGDLPRAPAPREGAPWTLIHLSWQQPNPWTDWSGNTQLRYSREGSVLSREGGWVRLPDRTAVELGLRPLGRDRSVWPVLAVGLFALVLAAAGSSRVRGRRAHAEGDRRAIGLAARSAEGPPAP